MSWFDQFKRKYDPSKNPLAAAIEHFHPQLSEWQAHDEWRLSMSVFRESSFGWGGLDQLGMFLTKDQRTIASFASSGTSNLGEIRFEMLVSTRKESFSYVNSDNSNLLVYYGNTLIGRINDSFQVFNTQNQMIMHLDTVQMAKSSGQIFGLPFNAIGPAPFRFYTGLCGWFNIPPRKKLMNSYGVLVEGQAMSVIGRTPEPYERMWMLAVYFLLRLGTGWLSHEVFVTTAGEDVSDFILDSLLY